MKFVPQTKKFSIKSNTKKRLTKKTKLTKTPIIFGLAIAAVAVLSIFYGLRGVKSASASTSTNANVRAVVLFVGDSNITLAAAEINWALTTQASNDNPYVPVMTSRVGSGIRTVDCPAATLSTCKTYDYWKIKLAQILPKVQPDVVVNDLGINDTAFLGTTTTPGYAGYSAKIDYMMNLLPAGKPVLWTNLPCTIEPATRLTGCKWVNAQLNLAKSRWPNFVLVDWASVANSHPEYMSPPDTNVHYTTAGRAAWTALILNTLNSKFPAS